MLPVLSAEEPVTLTNKSGKSLKAYLIAADSKNVTVKVADSRGQEFTLPLKSLSAASVKKIKAWKTKGGGLSADYEISFKSGKVSAHSKNEDYDDRTLKLTPEATLKNTDYRLKTGKQQVTLLLFGKSVTDSRAYYVFLNETKSIGEIESLEELLVKFSDVRIDYDDRGYAKYGSRYHGYAVLVHDGKGALLAIKTVPSTLEKHGLDLLKLKARGYYDRSMQEYSLRQEDEF
ncbi:MAG: hypothetical protein ACSHX2_00860 [Rubritalea sp.]